MSIGDFVKGVVSDVREDMLKKDLETSPPSQDVANLTLATARRQGLTKISKPNKATAICRTRYIFSTNYGEASLGPRTLNRG
ncbi:hypothetical protein SAMN02982922_3872 [Mesorhizobium australicum]|uniref:Uncharacterized protein n=1 Tax=Mesorhizobium australicum TaxID=536018 RepID=A0A1X7PDG1_9HYPH|nr:hypothetical protein SAMN02982922_3872 [Mesorhizobium australicum]